MSLTVDIALGHLGRRRRQTVVSVLGVALGVGFFIGMASLMQGFQRYFTTKVIDVSPHIVMKDEYRTAPLQPVERLFGEGAVALSGLKPRDERRGIRNAKAKLAAIVEIPGLVAAPTLRGQVFLRYGSKDVSATLVGIEPSAERRVSNLEKDLIAGTLDALQTSANGVILGEGLAQKLGAAMGNNLSAVSSEGIVLSVKVVGIFRTGITAMDNGEAYALLKKVQVLEGRINVINQINMRLSDITRARPLARAIEERFGYRTESWEEVNENVLGIFVIQNAIMYSTVGAILVVAAFGIFNIISTVVLEKTRDIAILKSIGLAERDIEAIFLVEGLLVGVAGMVLGWCLGYALVEVLASLEFKTEGFVRTQGFVLYRWWGHYAIAGAFALLSAGLAAFLPARKAARVNPVDIVRGAA